MSELDRPWRPTLMLRRALPLLLLPLALTACGVETTDTPGSSVAEGTADAPGSSVAEGTAESPDAATAESPTGTAESSGGQEAGADVAVQSCERGDFGTITATLAVTNSTNSPKSYFVTVSADAPDGTRVAELNAAANSIQPGQTATVDALGSVAGGEAPEGLTCTVVNVNRF